MRTSRVFALLFASAIATAAMASNRYVPVGTFAAPCGELDHLEGVTDVVVSPDDAFVYASAGTDRSLSVFARDGVTGALTLVEQYLDTDPGMSVLDFPGELAISPDGATLYVASAGSDNVVAFTRNPGDGSLSFVDVETDGVGGVTAMDEPRDVVVSPDGLHVYVASQGDQGVAIFARDGGTGALTPLGAAQQGVGGVVGMELPQVMTISPDGAHVYVSAHSVNSLVFFERSAVTGLLTYVGRILRSFGTLAVSSDGSFVYAAGDNFGPGFGVGINVFARNPTTGVLTFSEFESMLQQPDVVALEPSGDHVYAWLNLNNPRIDILARDAGTGGLTPVANVPQSNDGVDGLESVRGMAFPSSGTQLYTGAFSDAAVGTFDRDGVTGLLTQTGVAFDSGPPLVAALSPGGEHVYVGCARSIATLDRDAMTGELSFVDSRKHASIAGSDLVFGSNPGRPRITVAPNGAHVYFERGGIDSDLGIIEVLARDGLTGALSAVQALDVDDDNYTVPAWPSGIAVSPDDEHVYVSQAYGLSVMAYDRDPVTGLLSFVEYENTFGELEGRDVALSPDGGDVYLLGRDFTGNTETRIRVFSRDPGTGALNPTFLADQMPNFDFDAALALSSDGANAYAGLDGGAVSSLARDQVSGALAAVSSVKDGTAGATELVGLQRIALAPDDGHAFAVSNAPGSFSVLRRQADTGELSFVESHADGAVGTEALGGAEDILVSPDSQFVYAVAEGDESITIFTPDPACTPAPVPACQVATRGKLKIKTPGGDKKRVIVWKWQSSAVPVVGEPLTTSDLALCLYDASVGSQPLVDAVAPASGTCGPRPCWQAIDAIRKYADKEQTPDGLQTVKIVPKPGATSTVLMKARGTNVPTFSLPLTGPVTVQLQASTGECLQATFAATTLNDATQFLATLP